jgi:hypothetical protein
MRHSSAGSFLALLVALTVIGLFVSLDASAAEVEYEAYVACGMGHTAPAATSCQEGDHVSAYLRASHETEYVLCVQFPSGELKCADPEVIPADTVYANRIFSTELGTDHVTWLVGGKVVAESSVRLERRQVRLATQIPETPLQVRPSFIGYTGDGTGYLGGLEDDPRRQPSDAGGGLHWLSWGPRSALARGWDWLNDCRPDCARGRFHRFPTIVRARRPRHGLFTRMTIKTDIHGRWSYDHRILAYSPPQRIGDENFPAFWSWGICDARFTPRC